MKHHDPVLVAAGVVVTLACFLLIAYVVRVTPATRTVKVLGAVGSVIVVLPAVLYALYG